MTVTAYELPWIAVLSQRQLEAQVLVGAYTEEIFNEGVKGRVKRFLEEFGRVPDVYKSKLAGHFNGDVPAKVVGILGSVAEHVGDFQQNLAEDLYNDDTSMLGLARVAAKMAATTADIRALNHILGL